MCIVQIYHTYTDRDTEKETAMETNRNERQLGKNPVHSGAGNGLKSLWPLGGDLENIPCYLHITYLSLRTSPK